MVVGTSSKDVSVCRSEINLVLKFPSDTFYIRYCVYYSEWYRSISFIRVVLVVTGFVCTHCVTVLRNFVDKYKISYQQQNSCKIVIQKVDF